MKTKKNKKPSFWQIRRQALKEAKERYKAQIEDAINRRKLLNSHSDWSMIETFVQQCNQNPDLKVTIRLLDGTTIIMTAYKPERVSMNQMLNEITIEDR
jgi:hypothetical protein